MPEMILIVLAVVVAFAIVIAFAWGRRRANTDWELGFTVGCETVERGWWLWESFDLYGTIQYTYRGVPIGAPVRHRIKSVKKVDPEAVKETIAAVAALATRSPAPLAVLSQAQRAAAALPPHVDAPAVQVQSKRASGSRR
jgi:hypothetical protein